MDNLELPVIKVKIKLKTKSLLSRLGIIRNKRSFSFYPLSPNSCNKIAEMKGNDSLIYQDKANYIIAMAIHNDKNEPPKRLIKWLDKNLNSIETAILMRHANTQFDVKSLMKALILVRGLNVLNVPEQDVQNAKKPD